MESININQNEVNIDNNAINALLDSIDLEYKELEAVKLLYFRRFARSGCGSVGFPQGKKYERAFFHEYKRQAISETQTYLTLAILKTRKR